MDETTEKKKRRKPLIEQRVQTVAIVRVRPYAAEHIGDVLTMLVRRMGNVPARVDLDHSIILRDDPAAQPMPNEAYSLGHMLGWGKATVWFVIEPDMSLGATPMADLLTAFQRGFVQGYSISTTTAPNVYRAGISPELVGVDPNDHHVRDRLARYQLIAMPEVDWELTAHVHRQTVTYELHDQEKTP